MGETARPTFVTMLVDVIVRDKHPADEDVLAVLFAKES
jgi:hypothetical protein